MHQVVYEGMYGFVLKSYVGIAISLNKNVRKDRNILLGFPHEVRRLPTEIFFCISDTYRQNHVHIFQTDTLRVY